MTQIILTIIGSTAVFGFIQFLINRHDLKKAGLSEIGNRLNSLDEKIDKYEAQQARREILRFNDELYMGKMHTKEHFDNVLDDCTLYNQYCDDHPKFKNKRTEHAQSRIEEVYDKCNKHHLFLDGNDEEDKL